MEPLAKHGDPLLGGQAQGLGAQVGEGGALDRAGLAIRLVGRERQLEAVVLETVVLEHGRSSG